MIKRLIERPIAVSMSCIAIIVLGFVAMSYLPVSLMPDIDIPQITVQVSDPGASVREIDAIVKPIKNQLTQVVGLKTITTEARSDAGTIFMTFEPGNNIDITFIEVNERIDRSMSNLTDIERPKVLKASATDIPAFYMNLTVKGGVKEGETTLPEAGVRFTELGNFAREVIAKRIEQQKDVAMVDVSGVVTPELLIVPDYKKLTSMGEDVDLLEEAINDNNITLGALSIKDGEYRYNIHFDSEIGSKEDIENIYINHNGRVYQFKELCKVVERPAARQGLVRSGRENSITMAIIKQSDSKMESLQEGMNKMMEEFEKEYPDIEFEITRDQTKLLTYSINNLKNNLVAGALLACFIIFFFMKDFRSPLLIIITIPLALIVTLLAFNAIGITINIISLSGLVLGVGMMVDNSIIVIDNIMQKWQKGLPLKDAIAKAVGEVFTPMLSSVLTTCSVFLPLIFLSGVAGALFYDQAMAVTIALFSSLFVSVLVIPVYFYQLYKNKNSDTENKFLARFTNINYYRPYEWALKLTLRHRAITLLIFFLTIPAAYFVYGEIEKSRLPQISHDDAVMTIDWNSGITLDENDKRVGELLSHVSDKIEQSTSMVGQQQFLLSHTKDITPSESIVYIKTENDKVLLNVQNEIENYINEKYPNALVEFAVSGNIFDMIFSENEADLVAELQKRSGSSLTVTDVERVIDTLLLEVPDIEVSSIVKEQNIRYIADVEAMSIYNVDFSRVNRTLLTLTSQNDLFSINKGGYTIPVTTGEEGVQSSDILAGKVINSEGVEIPLDLIIKEVKGEDFKRLFSGKTGNYYPIEITVDEKATEKSIERVNEVLRGTDYFVTFTGGYFSSREMVSELMIILIVAIGLLYFILAAQFESIVQPLIILSEIVIDLFWVMLGLWLLGESLNLMSLIGIVVMSGIIINDSILKVDTINRLRKEGMPMIKAVFVGGHSRLKPILMTTFTTVLALVPFLSRVDMGSDLQYPLSLAIIIGMVVGTMVSLVFIPAAYYTIYNRKAKK
ncbi:MAG: efflux RND transporter permease subunit [Rikenellaceae bacterium]